MFDETRHEPFASTRWSLVRRAERGRDPEPARAALAELCRAYWRPLYAWLRRDGHPPDAALDLVQGFVADLLEREHLGGAVEGRFRNYLLGALRHHVANVRRSANALRRGGGLERIDAEAGERLLAQVESAAPSPDEAFDRAYALALLERSVTALQREFDLRGQTERFAVIRPLLDGEGTEGGYAEIAARAGTSVGALRVAVHRARQRLGELIRAEVAQTVDDPGEVEEELRAIQAVLG